MRFGLIGLGSAGRSHLGVLHAMEDVELVGIADLNPEAVEACGRQYQVPLATTDHRRLLDDPSIEVIAIAAGDKAHYPLVMDCAAAGKHVCCEKPIATEIAHGREMVEAMDRAGKLFAIAFNNRADQVTCRLKELVWQGHVGNIRMVRLVGLMAQPDNRHLRPLIGDEAALRRAENICIDGKNALFDCGVHSFDFARHLVGSEFTDIVAVGYEMRGFGYPDHGVALCSHANGVLSLIEKSFVYAYESETRKEYVRYDIEGDEGSLSWDLDTHRLKLFARNETLDEEVSHLGKEGVRHRIYQGFIDSVRAGALQPWLATGLDGLRAIEAAQAATDAMLARGVLTRDIGRAANWFGPEGCSLAAGRGAGAGQ